MGFREIKKKTRLKVGAAAPHARRGLSIYNIIYSDLDLESARGDGWCVLIIRKGVNINVYDSPGHRNLSAHNSYTYMYNINIEHGIYYVETFFFFYI